MSTWKLKSANGFGSSVASFQKCGARDAIVFQVRVLGSLAQIHDSIVMARPSFSLAATKRSLAVLYASLAALTFSWYAWSAFLGGFSI